MRAKLPLFALFTIVFLSFSSAQVPSPPQNLRVEQGLYGGAVLHWDSSMYAGAYRVYKSSDESPFSSIAVVHHREFVDWSVYPHQDYAYYVTAFNESGESDPSDTVQFELDRPPVPHVHGVIQGVVEDNNTHQPLREAVVQFFGHEGLWSARTHTDTSGAYSASVDTGRYFVRADKFGYESQWYNNVSRIDSAWVVDLHQDTVTANFSLHPLPVPVPVAVSGTVTDSVSGLPLPNAFVAVLRPFHQLRELEDETGFFDGFPSERFELPELGFLHGVVWLARTDSAGNYTAHVLSGSRYVVMAFKPGYLLKFYQDKRNPFDADRISLAHDTSGIDFSLVPNPAAVNTISGAVTDSSGLGVPSHLVLFRRFPHAIVPVRFRMTDSVGGFTFFNLPQGYYLLKAIPVVNYAAAWYNASSCGVSNWHWADSIHVTGNVSGIDLCVVPATGGGFARIAGQVTQSPGTALPKSSGSKLSTPAAGVTVYALSIATNAVIGSDVTEDDGSFSIENLPPGSYSIVVDKEGFTTGSAPAYTVDGSNGYQVTNASAGISPDVTLSVGPRVVVVPKEYRLEQNYPNPFNPVTAIRFEIAGKSVVSLRIYNLIGQQIASLVDGVMDAGTYGTQWNAQDNNGTTVGTGIYFAKLVASPVNGSGQVFSQVRKMILLK
jgi:hypothetical protein